MPPTATEWEHRNATDFTITSFDCPDCTSGQWRTVTNVRGTPAHSSLLAWSDCGHPASARLGVLILAENLLTQPESSLS